MTDNYTDDDFDSDEIEDIEPESGSPRGLRRAANKSKKLESELAQMKRELAFAKAGINPDDPRMKYFVKGYDGELTAEAVRQAAVEAGFIQSQTAQAAQQANAALGAESRVAQASAGAIMPDTGEDAALLAMEQAMEEGGVDAMLEVARQYGIPIGSEM